jgi:Cys-rich protein (TIGR01571 family)
MDGGVFLEASSAGTTATSALAQRLAKVEALESAEKEALAAQQQVLRAIVAQQAAFAAQQQGLKAEHEQMEAQMQKTSLIARLRAKADPALAVFEFRWKEILLNIFIYVTFALICGYIYGEFFTYEFDMLKQTPPANRENFAFNLLAGLHFDPDWRICVFSCFCTPVRWAATASNERIRFIHYWTGIGLFAFLTACAPLTLTLSSGTLLVITTRNRQRIRKVYGMPYGNWATVLQDCCIWLICPTCATMQEAMQVEFMDPPLTGDRPATVSTAFAPQQEEGSV